MAWKCESTEIKCSLIEKTTIILNLRVQDKVRLLMQEQGVSHDALGVVVGPCLQVFHVAGFAEGHDDARGDEADAGPFDRR